MTGFVVLPFIIYNRNSNSIWLRCAGNLNNTLLLDVSMATQPVTHIPNFSSKWQVAGQVEVEVEVWLRFSELVP